MARKGQPKVRTGCSTCKTRKVKCDEARPHCQRCTKTGRKCDGYVSQPPGVYSWGELLAIRAPPAKPCDVKELRSLGYFRHTVAPILSGLLDSSFWTQLVTQVAHQDAATRHAVVAVSALYEGFEDTPEGLAAKVDDTFAISHYNQAISKLLSSKKQNVDTVLIICVLFVCIELLRGDAEAAISHSRHGLQLLNSAHADPRLTSMFRHMSIFPLFFGATLSELPGPVGPDIVIGQFDAIEEARKSLDDLTVRAICMIRMGDPYRLGLESHLSPQIFHDQHRLCMDLETWSIAMSKLTMETPQETHDVAAHLMLKVRNLVCKVWAKICLSRDETVSDDYVATFEAIIGMATHALAIQQPGAAPRPKFLFDMGFAPLLHFVVIKCRHLHLRMAALSLMRALSSARETLWDVATMHATGVRIIEIEHGIQITHEGAKAVAAEGTDQALPSDDQRIRDSWCEEIFDEQMCDDGTRVIRRRIHFLLKTSDGSTIDQPDWITFHNL